MEIPTELKALYNHWSKHTAPLVSDIAVVNLDLDLLDQIETFATERMNIWEKRYKNEKPPFTNDKVLSQFKFCNIYRELDKQTIQIHQSLKPFLDNFDLWFLNLMYQRFICKPETIEKTGFLSFNEAENQKIFENLRNLDSPKYGNAYVFPISIIQKTKNPTREEFFCFELPEITQKIAPVVKKFKNESANEAMQKLCKESGFNFKFHFTEILIDVAYQFPELINLFDDFYIGPGSIPTMKALSKDDPMVTCKFLSTIKLKNFPYLTFNKKPVMLSVENWEGIGCEFRKYTNLSKGMGRKRFYS